MLEAAGIDRPDIVASLDGAAIATYVAATRPDRVGSLVLLNPWVKGRDNGVTPPGITDWARREWQAVIDCWGEGRSLDLTFPSLDGSPLHRRMMATFERTAAAPGTIRALADASEEIDVTAVLPSVRASTVVVANRGDRILPIEQARYVAASIANAEIVELDGIDSAVQYEHTDAVMALIDRFLDNPAVAGDSDRVFAAVVFSDIVSSTALVARLGDAGWHLLRRSHDTATRRAIERHDGTEIKSTGDGFLVTFADAQSALRYGLDVVPSIREVGLEVRVGIHAGEVQIIGDDVTGMSVHAAARICLAAGAGELLVSEPVRELSLDAGLSFADRGEHELRGVPAKWRLYAVASAPKQFKVESRRIATRTDRVRNTAIRHAPALARATARRAQRQHDRGKRR
ncbi:MAG: adenylate/guanylate cyclase domain-containing protein [Solirubrobacteraceae bacterium]